VGDATVELTDLGQMRALAHPLRLRLLGALRLDGPATATALADRLGISPALASYHLRRLAASGFIDPAPERARDGKERWWRAVHERTRWETTGWLDTPERAAAEQALSRQIVRALAERAGRWIDEAPSAPREWVDAADMSDWAVELGPDELRDLRAELHEVVERRAGGTPRPGARRVFVSMQLLPETQP
jgi:DNA-binding transcriptional ArsR family regulator